MWGTASLLGLLDACIAGHLGCMSLSRSLYFMYLLTAPICPSSIPYVAPHGQVAHVSVH